MKIKIFRTIILLLLIGTFFIIFRFSSQNGTQSKGISTKVTEVILEKSSKYNQLDNKEKKKVFNRANAVIRKIAHFSIYTLVGLLLMGIMTRTKLKDKRRILITVIIGIIYATLDEFHQSFSPGRTPKITDVYIDTLGVILGILLVLTAREIYNRYITNRLQRVTKNVI